MTDPIVCSHHNGIPVWWADLPGVCSGSLIIGVGSKDEPPQTLGISHLLEHIILNRMEPITVGHEAVAAEETVTFTAWGDPDDVAAFLNAVAESIRIMGQLTEKIVTLEKQTVEAENPSAYNSVSGGLLTYRFGLPGIGSSNSAVPTMDSITRQELIDWAAGWFVADNAALTFDTPPPAHLDVRLPDAARASRSVGERRATATPVLVRSVKAGIALSLIVDVEEAFTLGEAFRFELLATLRHRFGLVYSVSTYLTRVNADQTEIALILDPLNRNTAKTLRKSITALRQIAVTGFSAPTMEAVHNLVKLYWDDESRDAADLETMARDHLFDRTTVRTERRLAAARASTGESLRLVLERSLETLLVAYDEDQVKKSELPSRSVIARDEFWAWRPLTPADLATVAPDDPTWASEDGKRSVIVTASHIVEVSAKRPRGLTLADVRLAGVTPTGELTLIDNRGRSTQLDHTDATDWDGLRAAILDRIPAEIVRRFTGN